MNINNISWTPFTVVQRKKRIDPRPQYQRTEVWSESRQQLLIDSMLRGYDLPKLYLRVIDREGFEHEVTDGQQRLNAIWSFCQNKFPLGEFSEDLPRFGNLANKLWDDLPSDARDKIGLFNLSIVEITDASDLEIRELFLRLQEGVALNPQEKRNAMPGDLRDFIADIAETHKVLALTGIKRDRYEWHNLVAHIAALEIHGGPHDIKAPNLKALYEQNEKFDKHGKTATKIKKCLNVMARVLNDKPPEMNIKWGFVDLYLLISSFDGKYSLQGHESELNEFYISFEQARRSIDDSSDLLKGDSWDKEMYEYLDPFQRSGASRDNIQKRHNIYTRRALNHIENLVPIDQKRGFTKDERIVLLYRAGNKCQHCGDKITLTTMHADHIDRHRSGGATVIMNGQALCKECNLKKG